MRRSGFGWWRLAKQVVLGAAEAVASFANTTFTAASATGTADGATTNTLTLTLRDANNAVMPLTAVTFTTELTAVDAAQSTLASNTSTIEATTGTATITAYLLNASGVALPNIAAARLSLTSTGSGNTITAVDTVTDRNGRFRWTFVSTVAAAKTLTLVADGTTVTQTAAITVSGGGAGLWTPMLQADWGTATGVTSNAISDGGLFDQLTTDFEDSAEVIAAPVGEGWESTNVLKVYSAAGVRSGYIETRCNTLGELAEGEVRNYRWGYSNKHPTAAEGASDNSHHGIQDGSPSGSGSDQNWNLTDGTNYVGEWEPNILTGGNSTGSRYYLNSTATPARLTKGVKYTFDIQVERGSGANTNAFQMRAWVYDDTGVEIYGPVDWKSSLYPGETLATTRWIAFNNRAGSDSIAFGLNGTAGTWPIYHSDQGEVAVVSSLDNGSLTLGTSIGPYGSVTGE